MQIVHARHLSDAAKRIKLADKIANRRDSLAHPPTDWSEARKREYVDRAAQGGDGLRGCHPGLEAGFDDLYQRASRVVG